MVEKQERANNSRPFKEDGNERHGVPSPEKEKELPDSMLEDVAGGVARKPLTRPKKPE